MLFRLFHKLLGTPSSMKRKGEEWIAFNTALRRHLLQIEFGCNTLEWNEFTYSQRLVKEQNTGAYAEISGVCLGREIAHH